MKVRGLEGMKTSNNRQVLEKSKILFRSRKCKKAPDSPGKTIRPRKDRRVRFVPKGSLRGLRRARANEPPPFGSTARVEALPQASSKPPTASGN